MVRSWVLLCDATMSHTNHAVCPLWMLTRDQRANGTQPSVAGPSPLQGRHARPSKQAACILGGGSTCGVHAHIQRDVHNEGHVRGNGAQHHPAPLHRLKRQQARGR